MNYIVTVLMVLFVILGGLFFFQRKMDDQFNGWLKLCANDGGIVTLTGIGISSHSYECIRDGKIIDHIN